MVASGFIMLLKIVFVTALGICAIFISVNERRISIILSSLITVALAVSLLFGVKGIEYIIEPLLKIQLMVWAIKGIRWIVRRFRR